MLYNIWVRNFSDENNVIFRLIRMLSSIPIIGIVLLFSACSEVTPQVFIQNAQTQPIVIAYDPSEGLNPYLTDALVTHQMGSLLYCSLFVLDDSLSPAPLLASSATATSDNTSYAITINSGFTFADSSQVTTQDVAASITAAQGSNFYSLKLQNIDTVSVSDSSVTIALFEPDAFFLNLLTMPILKASEVSAKNPSASGDYHLVDNTLISRKDSVDIAFAEIEVVDVSQPSALTDSLNLGIISILDTTFLPDFVPNSQLAKSLYPTTSMLFIGFASEAYTANERVFVSSAIDRSAIVENVFGGVGVESMGIINPAYSFCEQESVHPISSEKTEYSLLYNNEIAGREAVISQLEMAFAKKGLTLTAISAPGTELFNELLLQGEYDLYLAEIMIPENLDFSYFFNESSPGYTEYFSQDLKNAYMGMKSTGNIAEFCSLFSKEQPIAPIMFREGTVYHRNDLTKLTPQNSKPYYHFNEVNYD